MLTLTYLAELAQQYADDLRVEVKEFDIAGRSLNFNTRSALMGVVNLSPDSWYRESVCLTVDSAVQRGQVLAAQGADLIDLGAESTLAHAARADAQAQENRLLPVIRALHGAGIPVSVETYKPEVAAACLEAGAAVLNLTGPASNEEMFRLASDHDAAVIICYVQGPNVREVGDFDFGSDPIEQMREFFARELDKATQAGLNRIFLDPGLGFYYRNLQDSTLRIRYQMRTLLSTFRLRQLGFPICHALPHAFEFFREEVRCAEPYYALLAVLGKTDLLRTHEIPRVRAVLQTLTCF
jgi:dihydropteroate synthase